MSPASLFLGIDPGASASMALVRASLTRSGSVAGDRPHLVAAWSIYGSTRAAWDRRLDQALQELAAHDVEAAWMEIPGGRGKTINRYSSDWLLGLGKRIGRMQEALRQRLELQTMDLSSGDWPGLVGVRVGKVAASLRPKAPEGAHRLGEAALHVVGAVRAPRTWAGLSDAEAERLVSISEATLIAAAGVEQLRRATDQARRGPCTR